MGHTEGQLPDDRHPEEVRHEEHKATDQMFHFATVKVLLSNFKNSHITITELIPHRSSF